MAKNKIFISTDLLSDDRYISIRKFGVDVENFFFKLLLVCGLSCDDGVLLTKNGNVIDEEYLSIALGIDVGDVDYMMDCLKNSGIISEIENGNAKIEDWGKLYGVCDTVKKPKSKQAEPESEKECFNPKGKNVRNLLYLVNSYGEKANVLTEDKLLYASILRWMRYKDEKGGVKNRYSEIGMKELMNAFVKYSKKYSSSSVASLVSDNMASNYMGIQWQTLYKYKNIDKEEKLPEKKEEKVESRFEKIPQEDLERLSKIGVIDLENESISLADAGEEDIEILKKYGAL